MNLLGCIHLNTPLRLVSAVLNDESAKQDQIPDSPNSEIDKLSLEPLESK